MTPDAPGILFCNCTYAQVIDPAVKATVLRRLCDSGRSFEAVADLCEMSARKDPALKRLAGGDVKIAACFPRAVKWLFASAGAPLDGARTEVLNMRELAAEPVVERLLADGLQPNLPPGKAAPVASTIAAPIASTIASTIAANGATLAAQPSSD